MEMQKPFKELSVEGYETGELRSKDKKKPPSQSKDESLPRRNLIS